MSFRLGKGWLENLSRAKSLVREALQKNNLEDFLLHVAVKDNIITIVSQCNEGICYECGRKITKDGLKLYLEEKGFLKIIEKPYKVVGEFYFHRYHF